MYEFALSEWHLTPDYINSRWTEELLSLMFQSRGRRLQRGKKNDDEARPVMRKVSNDEFFARHGNFIKVRKV